MTRVHTFLLFSSLEGHLQWQIRSPNPALVHSWTESLEAVAKENKTVLHFRYTHPEGWSCDRDKHAATSTVLSERHKSKNENTS